MQQCYDYLFYRSGRGLCIFTPLPQFIFDVKPNFLNGFFDRLHLPDRNGDVVCSCGDGCTRSRCFDSMIVRYLADETAHGIPGNGRLDDQSGYRQNGQIHVDGFTDTEVPPPLWRQLETHTASSVTSNTNRHMQVTFDLLMFDVSRMGITRYVVVVVPIMTGQSPWRIRFGNLMQYWHGPCNLDRIRACIPTTRKLVLLSIANPGVVVAVLALRLDRSLP